MEKSEFMAYQLALSQFREEPSSIVDGKLDDGQENYHLQVDHHRGNSSSYFSGNEGDEFSPQNMKTKFSDKSVQHTISDMINQSEQTDLDDINPLIDDKIIEETNESNGKISDGLAQNSSERYPSQDNIDKAESNDGVQEEENEEEAEEEEPEEEIDPEEERRKEERRKLYVLIFKFFLD